MRVVAARRMMGRRSSGGARPALSGALSGALSLGLVFASLAFAAQGADSQQRVTVDYLSIERTEGFASRRVYAGTTVAVQASELGFKQRGEIAKLTVDIGSRVEKGDLLGQLDAAALKAQVQQAQANVTFSRANLAAQQADTELAAQTEARYRNLKAKGHVSAQLFDETRLALRSKRAQLSVAGAAQQRSLAELSAAKIAVNESRIVAPFAGVIQQRYKDLGSQVSPGEPVLRLVADDSSEAHVGVPAAVAQTLVTGDNYLVRWNSSDYPAVMRAVAPEINVATRTLTAVFELKGSKVPLGAVVELALEQQVAEPGFWVPVSALTESDRGLWGVYVVDNDSVVRRQLVEIVHTESARVFVRGTLSSSDRVIGTGVQRVVPGQQVELGRKMNSAATAKLAAH